ncbi:origin recognition complex subunit [Purpureocillium lavendulum]|uniref:Origin recognition complex subunit n=1 Tax=Purpureocillium lavendulum TaxID=1247861 RepID=A0AB34G446_9HYPO|nr:origin recognition complex subunit [Purpureocillium lavendulum]
MAAPGARRLLVSWPFADPRPSTSHLHLDTAARTRAPIHVGIRLGVGGTAHGAHPPPPVSPITPTLAPARLPDTATPQPLLPPPSQALHLPALTHSSQPAQQTAVPPPPPEPLDFDANPDVLALKSAISVLQVQRRRAAADMQTLTRAKDEALADPQAFMRDLAAGKVKSRGDDARYVPGGSGGGRGHDEDEDEDSSDDDGDSSDSSASGSKSQPKPKEWTSLPQPQNVVRCPPINWSQYAVVGDSLDKLHAEQVSRPTQGMPASIGTGGVYEFKGDGRQEKYPGVAAPYAPGKDRIDKKPKGKKS